MKAISTILLFLLCLNLNGQKNKTFLSSWIDSEETEMSVSSDSYTYFGKGKMYCFFSNNNNNVILNLMIEDPVVQNLILRQGLTIWIDMDRKPVRKTGIRFPIGYQYLSNHSNRSSAENQIDPAGTAATPLSLAKTIELIGFSGEDARYLPAYNSDSFRGSITYDDKGVLYYKMVIPISKLAIRNSKDGQGAMPFSFGIEYGAAPVVNNQNRSGSYKISTSPVLIWIKNVKLASN